LILDDQIEAIATQAVDCAPGLLESAYGAVLENRLRRSGLAVARQKSVSIIVDGLTLSNVFKVDLLVEGRLLLELKSVEQMTNLHSMQVLTYLRLMNLPLGLLINFNTELFKHGVKRIINNHAS
jgi:GxxExxY protein